MATKFEVHQILLKNPMYRLARKTNDIELMKDVLSDNGFGNSHNHIKVMLNFKSYNDEYESTSDPSKVVILATPPSFRGGNKTSIDLVWYTILGQGNLRYSMKSDKFKSEYRKI